MDSIITRYPDADDEYKEIYVKRMLIVYFYNAKIVHKVGFGYPAEYVALLNSFLKMLKDKFSGYVESKQTR